MPKLQCYIATASILVISWLVLFPVIADAQSKSIEVDSVFDIADKSAADGDILVNITGVGLTRSIADYDPRLFGVLQLNPLLVYRRTDNSGTPISRYGIAEVNVTTLNGPISNGDYITSSEIAGKGQKASSSGYVIGAALGSFSDQDGQPLDYESPTTKQTTKIRTGKVLISLRIEYAEITRSRFLSGVLNLINAALFKNLTDPNKSVQLFKFSAAGLVIFISFLLGFLSFSRSIPKSVEAIGRNPLAEKAIHFSVILNIILTAITALLGIAAAIIILRL